MDSADGGREDGCRLTGSPKAEGGGDGADGADDAGDSGGLGFGTEKLSLIGESAPVPSVDVRGKPFLAEPGGCNVRDGWRFVGEAMRTTLGDAAGAGDTRALVFGDGLAGLLAGLPARDAGVPVDRREFARARLTPLGVRAWPGRSAAAGVFYLNN